MKRYKKRILLLFSLLPIINFGQSESVFNGISLNESLETVEQKLSGISEALHRISVKDFSFPLARTKEEHLVCSKVNTEYGVIDRIVFTFADDKLSYIEARGNTSKVFKSHRKDTARTYLDYEVYVKDKLFLNKKKDIARIMTEEAMHVNLFTWKNPYLHPNYKNDKKVGHSGKIPVFLKMGESINELKPLLEVNSEFTKIETLDGSDPNAQLQINCFGVEYLGFPRKIEARFGDDKLNVVWILTAKGEEDRIRKALIDQYGEPIFVNDAWDIFHNWQVGLRKDKPEVLLMTKEIGLHYKTNYFKQ